MAYKAYEGTRKSREFYVYRYTDKRTRDVVYIGKTNCSLKSRINAHKREEWFAPYDCDVDFIKLSNEVETDSVEKFLINYYKPCINLKDKVPFVTKEINLEGLDWHPYEEYLELLKTNKARKEILKREALKQVEVLDTLVEAYANGEDTIVLPYLASNLPYFDEWIMFVGKEVVSVEGGYQYALLPEAKKEIESKYEGILASIWMPLVSMWDISDASAKEFATLEYAFEIVKEMKEFAYNGYLYEEGFWEMCLNILPIKYLPAIFYFEKYTEPARIYSDGIYIEWSYEQDEKLPIILEEICKDFVKLVRKEEIWQFGE
jgi:hypothetical protein